MAGIYRQFSLFMATIEQTGILRKAMATHFAIAVLLCVGAELLVPRLLIPAAMVAVTHLASDIPNVIRVVRGRPKRR
jgi:hypothetical protein